MKRNWSELSLSFYKYLDICLQQGHSWYKTNVLNPLYSRYLDGERSKELYDAMLKELK